MKTNEGKMDRVLRIKKGCPRINQTRAKLFTHKRMLN